MKACFYNKEDISEVMHLEEVQKIELTERDRESYELVYYVSLTHAPDVKIMLPYDRWRLMWADKYDF